MAKHIKQRIATGNYSLKASQGKPQLSSDKPDLQNALEEKLCLHENYCNIRKFGRINCMKPKDCRTYKFYQRYGENWNQLGI